MQLWLVIPDDFEFAKGQDTSRHTNTKTLFRSQVNVVISYNFLYYKNDLILRRITIFSSFKKYGVLCTSSQGKLRNQRNEKDPEGYNCTFKNYI